MKGFATFNGESRASSIFENPETAQHLADLQNEKAENLGLKAQYSVKETEATNAQDKLMKELPSVWR